MRECSQFHRRPRAANVVRRIARLSFLIGVLIAPSISARADVITFDDINTAPPIYFVLPIPNGYHGLTWNNFGVANAPTYCCGYPYAAISSPNVAFNDFGNPASFGSSSSTFTLNSMYLTAGENDGLEVTVNGLLNGMVEDTEIFTLTSTSPVLATFHWSDINEVYFSASGGNPHGWVVDGIPVPSGTHFAMDNVSLTPTPPPTPTPLPAAAPLFAGGLSILGLLGWRRRRKAQAVA